MDKQGNVEGLIGFYKLQDWWFSSFTNEEREYIDNHFQPIGAATHTLTQGTILELNQSAPEFLSGLQTWFRSKEDFSISERIHKKLIELAKKDPIVKPGYYDGRHFTTYVSDIKILKRNGKFNELENLLLELIKATEAECAVDDMGVAPAYYRELAILYRKQKEYSKEVSILDRYAKQKHAPGVTPAKLLDRLEKAKELESKNLKGE